MAWLTGWRRADVSSPQALRRTPWVTLQPCLSRAIARIVRSCLAQIQAEITADLVDPRTIQRTVCASDPRCGLDHVQPCALYDPARHLHERRTIGILRRCAQCAFANPHVSGAGGSHGVGEPRTLHRVLACGRAHGVADFGQQSLNSAKLDRGKSPSASREPWVALVIAAFTQAMLGRNSKPIKRIAAAPGGAHSAHTPLR